MNFTTMRQGDLKHQKKMVTKELHLTQAHKDAVANGVLEGALITLVYSGKDLSASRLLKEVVAPAKEPEVEIKDSTLQQNVESLFDPNALGESIVEESK
jgi:hypothetical protein